MSDIRYIDSANLATLLQDKTDSLVLLDVREPHEFAQGCIANAVNMPLSSWDEEQVDYICKDKQVVIYCRSGTRTRIYEEQFQDISALKIMVLTGGILAWQHHLSS